MIFIPFPIKDVFPGSKALLLSARVFETGQPVAPPSSSFDIISGIVGFIYNEQSSGHASLGKCHKQIPWRAVPRGGQPSKSMA